MTVVGAQPAVTWQNPSLFSLPLLFQIPKTKLPSIDLTQGLTSPEESGKRSHPLLLRHLQSYTQTLSARQIQMDHSLLSFENAMAKPGNIVMLGAAGYILRSAAFTLKAEEALQLGNVVMSSASKYKWISAAATVAITGCAADGTTRDLSIRRDGGFDQSDAGSTDAGPKPIDKDEDGAPFDIDCDDENPDIFPLTGTPREIEITRSTRICPGTYNGFTLLVKNRSDLKLEGADVILDGHIDPDENPVANQAIRIDSSQNIEVSGFGLQFYEELAVPNRPGILRVQSSEEVYLHDLDVTAERGNWPLRLVDSQDVTVERVTTHTHSDRAIQAETCIDTLIKDCVFNSQKPYDYNPSYALVYINGGTKNVVTGVKMMFGQGCGLWVKNSPDFQALTNTILGSGLSGIVVDASSNGYYHDNNVHACGDYGLSIENHSKGNTFAENYFSGNSKGAYHADAGSNLMENTFLQNTPQP